MGKLLENVKCPGDIKNLSIEELNALSMEIREKIITDVSKNGGHLSSNLGVVELTVALHKVFNCPHDAFVWDVGHQSYAHKILTGRLEKFNTLRQKGGISGFPKHNESEYDAFVAGHASTSVSAALGIAHAKKLDGDDGFAIAIVGDGAFTGGLIYEGLNNSARSNTRLIVIINDNEMSISKNVGGLSKYFAKIRNRKSYFAFKDTTRKVVRKLPFGKSFEKFLIKIKQMFKGSLYKSTFFEDLGFLYLGPVDGHNIENMIDVFERAKNVNEPVVIHVNTVKGKGYNFAQENPSLYHGVSPFDAETGDLGEGKDSFTNHFSEILIDIASKNEKVCAITAAMRDSTGLKEFSKQFPNRFFDVGIAEQHAVTFSAALAQSGYVPIFAVYSTFLQRAYDQIIHDVAIENQHVVFAIDRAGIVGEDGETHNGVFDVAFLSHIPNMKIFSPTNYIELKEALNKAVFECHGPVAVRYPRGSCNFADDSAEKMGSFEVVSQKDSSTAIVTYGRIFNQASQAAKELSENAIKIDVVKMLQICPIDADLIEFLKKYERIYFFEEGIEKSGVAYSVLKLLLDAGYKGKVKITAIDDRFVAHSTTQQALDELGLSCEKMKLIITESEGICNND